MTVEEIPSDELVTMTSFWHKAFNAVGCNPMCHCCKKMLPAGTSFKLSTIEKRDYEFGIGVRSRIRMIPSGTTHTQEVMLCEDCTADSYKHYEEKMFSENEKEYLRREKFHQLQGGGCFRINGKIVH